MQMIEPNHYDDYISNILIYSFKFLSSFYNPFSPKLPKVDLFGTKCNPISLNSIFFIHFKLSPTHYPCAEIKYKYFH